MSGSRHSAGRQQKLHSQERADEDLQGRQAVLLGCPQLFYSHARAASPAGFLYEHALDTDLFAISFSKLQSHPTFAVVRIGGKGRKEAWL